MYILCYLRKETSSDNSTTAKPFSQPWEVYFKWIELTYHKWNTEANQVMRYGELQLYPKMECILRSAKINTSSYTPSFRPLHEHMNNLETQICGTPPLYT